MTITEVNQSEEIEREWEEEVENLQIMNDQLEKELPTGNGKFCFQR